MNSFEGVGHTFGDNGSWQVSNFLDRITAPAAMSITTATHTNTGAPYCYYNWYPTYWPAPAEDRMQRTFRIVKHLIAKKHIKLSTAKFIALVDELMEIA